MYGVLADGSGALKPAYDTGDGHPNDTGYGALDATYFPFLNTVFTSGSPPPPVVSRTWYFAEGCTDYGFEEFICIQNPTNDNASVRVTYMKSNGEAPVVADPFTLPSCSRATTNVGDYVPASEISTRVDSDKGVICERSMYWNYRGGEHDSIGMMSDS